MSTSAAAQEDISAVHTPRHIAEVRREGVYEIAALAAGGAIKAAEIGLYEPCFAVIRPPGHHASADSAWGFCYFNNMAIAITKLKRRDKIKKVFILDFDLHVGDGNINILGKTGYVTLLNPGGQDRNDYLKTVTNALEKTDADMIAVSAGFDNHEADWGGLLATGDYAYMGIWSGKPRVATKAAVSESLKAATIMLCWVKTFGRLLRA